MRTIHTAILLMAASLLYTPLAQSQTWQWATKPIGLAGTSFKQNAVAGIAIDDQDFSYIVGHFNDSASFQTVPMKSQKELDIYVAKLGPTGSLQWLRTVAGPYEDDQAIDVALDPAGNVYIAGYYADSLSFDGTVVKQAPLSMVAIAKYNNSGDLLWARNAEGLTIGVYGGLAYGTTGHLYLGCGHTLAKYTLDGDTVWTIQSPLTMNSLMINDIEVDASGSFVYATGQFSGAIDFGGVMLSTTGLTDIDVFIAKIDSDGDVIWAKQAGSTSGIWPETGYSIDVDQSGNLYICGQFTSTAIFDTQMISAGAALWQMFLAKYDGSDGSIDWVQGGSGDISTQGSATEVRLVSDETAMLVASYFNSSVTIDGSTFTFTGGDALVLMVSSDGDLIWGQQSGSTTAIITVNAMEVNENTSSAVLVGKHYSVAATFGTFTFTTPPVGSADGFIVGMSTDSPTDADEIELEAAPHDFRVAQNFPNPFNPNTTISFNLPRQSHVDVSIYNVLGQVVRRLADERASAGQFSVDWDGRSEDGTLQPTGVYFYRVTTDDYSLSRKMLLLK